MKTFSDQNEIPTRSQINTAKYLKWTFRLTIISFFISIGVFIFSVLAIFNLPKYITLDKSQINVKVDTVISEELETLIFGEDGVISLDPKAEHSEITKKYLKHSTIGDVNKWLITEYPEYCTVKPVSFGIGKYRQTFDDYFNGQNIPTQYSQTQLVETMIKVLEWKRTKILTDSFLISSMAFLGIIIICIVVRYLYSVYKWVDKTSKY